MGYYEIRVTGQGALFDGEASPSRSGARECPACGGVLTAPAERREGRCRGCISAGAVALRLEVES